MSLLSLADASFTWGGPQLLEGVNLEIGRNERIGLVGRNGAGKSTLLKILAGEVEPDNGSLRREPGVRIARLVQEVPESCAGKVVEIVARGYGEVDGRVDNPSYGPHDWQRERAVETVLTRMQLDSAADFGTLSSGMKRRVLLAQSLVHEPDVLLLDEPTNHLDITSIAWLEGFLKNYAGTLVFVTHDRVFLQNLATRIIEIDRGRLFDWTCDYATFLKRKQAALESEEKQNALFDQKLAEEEVWIRKGIKARRTRNEGRVRALKAMREQRRLRREQIGSVRMQAAAAEKSGQLVAEVKDVSFSYVAEAGSFGSEAGSFRYVEKPIVAGFSTLISRGDKIGVIGPNGAGKTTLLKLLLGELPPQSGTIRHGTRLQVIYFDQLREQIDEEKTVVENVGEGQETLLIDGKPKHIYGYLREFLFTPERARRPARFLSGGERNRLLLARLFKRPSNVMVLDEPTNDLDAETLELLEELVANYAGTVLVVSHDRAFLNNVVTSTLVLEGDGRVKEYDGGYDDYVRQREEAAKRQAESLVDLQEPKARPVKADGPAKLSYREQQELESLPPKIDALERERDELHTAMAAPEFYKQPGDEIARATARGQALETELAGLFARWEELESRA
jgi:ABC transport system ATP-binding/permease protein